MTYFVIANSSIYWAAELDSAGRFTGNFKYNYHALPPRDGRRNQISIIIGKIRNHLLGHYKFLGVMNDVPNPNETQSMYRRASRGYDFEAYLIGHTQAMYALTAEQITQLRAGQTVPGQRTPRIPPLSAAELRRRRYEEEEQRRREEIRTRDQRAIEEEVETVPTNVERETVSFEGLDEIPAYKTDDKGFLTTYDREYKRPEIVRERKNPEIKWVGKATAFGDRALFGLLKRFYDAIPATMVIAKREFDDSEQGLWGPHTGKHFFVLIKNVPVAGYEINTQQATSSFMYIKTTIPNYNDILKRSLEHMKTITGGASIIVLQFRGDMMKNKLLEIMPGTRITTIPSIKGAYKAEINTRSIPLVNLAAASVPDRWEDDA